MKQIFKLSETRSLTLDRMKGYMKESDIPRYAKSLIEELLQEYGTELGYPLSHRNKLCKPFCAPDSTACPAYVTSIFPRWTITLSWNKHSFYLDCRYFNLGRLLYTERLQEIALNRVVANNIFKANQYVNWAYTYRAVMDFSETEYYQGLFKEIIKEMYTVLKNPKFMICQRYKVIFRDSPEYRLGTFLHYIPD